MTPKQKLTTNNKLPTQTIMLKGLKKLVIDKKCASLLFLLAYMGNNERIKFFTQYKKNNPKKSPCIVCGDLIIHYRNRRGICSGRCRTRKFRQVHNL